MAVYRYIRFSTDKQDEQSQRDIIAKYCDARGIAIDDTIRDEGISGKEGSLSRRDLLKLLKMLKEGDTLVVSELSRITRGGPVELNKMIGEYFRPARIRLILCNYAMEFDCANLTPMNELILNCFAVFAKMERDSIVERTTAGLNVRKDWIAQHGGFTSKSGRWCTHLGAEKGCDMSIQTQASAKANADKAREYIFTADLPKYCRMRWEQGWSFTQIVEDCHKLYEIDPVKYGTRNGGKLNKGHLSRWAESWRMATGAADMSEKERRNIGKYERID